MAYEIHDADAAEALGQALAYWPWLEEFMTQIMHTLIHGKFADGDDELEPTRIVFQALVANSQRIRVMRALLAFSQRNRSRPVITIRS